MAYAIGLCGDLRSLFEALVLICVIWASLGWGNWVFKLTPWCRHSVSSPTPSKPRCQESSAVIQTTNPAHLLHNEVAHTQIIPPSPNKTPLIPPQGQRRKPRPEDTAKGQSCGAATPRAFPTPPKSRASVSKRMPHTHQTAKDHSGEATRSAHFPPHRSPDDANRLTHPKHTQNRGCA